MVRNKKKFPKGRWLVVGIIALVVVIYLFFNQSAEFNFSFLGRGTLKSTDNRVNILLLGIGGGNHDGALLTDSMIVLSYNLKTHQVVLFSIPRDLWLGDIKQKVNAAYEIGGLKFTEDKVAGVLGLPINYGLRMDFSSFAKAIDLVGGVDVIVPNSFDDYEFPIDGKENDLCGLSTQDMDLDAQTASQLNLSPGKQKVVVNLMGKVATSSADFACRFQHIHFDSGQAHLNGERSLQFVRSRHGGGSEGSDFARSKRQQLVIEAFRSQFLSLQTLSDPQKVVELSKTLGDGIETDIPRSAYLELYSLVKSTNSVKNVVLGDLGEGKSLFINPPLSDYGGMWVLIPPEGNFSKVSDFVRKTLGGNN